MTSLPRAGSAPAGKPVYWQPAPRTPVWPVVVGVVAAVLATLLVIGGLVAVGAVVLLYVVMSGYGSNK